MSMDFLVVCPKHGVIAEYVEGDEATASIPIVALDTGGLARAYCWRCLVEFLDERISQVKTFTTTSDGPDPSMGIQPGEIYRHYKGNLYEVIAKSQHSEDLSWMITYREIDSSQDNPKYWTRPAGMFEEMVEVEGGLVPRFQRYATLVK